MRKADILVALVLLGLAVLVAWESLQLNIGWGLNGPAGGIFPLLVGGRAGALLPGHSGPGVLASIPVFEATAGQAGRVGASPPGGPASRCPGGPYRDDRPLPGCCPLHWLYHALYRQASLASGPGPEHWHSAWQLLPL